MKPRILGLLAVAAGLAAAIGAVTRRRRQSPAAPQHRDPRDVAPDAPVAEAVDNEWSCECGKAYRFTGMGRHRVYWPAEATVADPVLDNQCVECERPFPMTASASG